jgi:hypothetical protein
MATEYGSIDDMLDGSKSAYHAETPEHQEQSRQIETDYEEEPARDNEMDLQSHDSFTHKEEPEIAEQESKPELNLDEYGNEKPAPRTYTEEEVNERINKAIRERLARGNQQQDVTQQQMQKAADSGFEFNEDSDVPWPEQLEHFVEKSFHKIISKQQQQQVQQQEQATENEFRDRFINGMERYGDFKQVVEKQPVTDYMTMALRGMNDPAAFIYAASKRAPAELSRISQINDPYAQIVEMGKLEERMRKAANQSNAPKPIARTRDDAKMPLNSKKRDETIEDLIAQADAKKKAQYAQRRGNR